MLWLAIVLSACEQPPILSGGDTSPAIVKSRDFAFIPCGPIDNNRYPCALVVAGGKRILFGAPAGVASTISPDNLRQIDAVMLFSLHAGDIEGVDEIRNASWRAGRRQPLPVIGPQGTERVVTALNQAFEQADALHIVAMGRLSGDYSAAVLYGHEAHSGETVFDTGDVSVRFVLPSVFSIKYMDAEPVIVSGCQHGKFDDNNQKARQARHRVIARIGCDSRSKWQWPLPETVFIVRY